MTKRLNLVAAGFIRREDLDFSDDGSYFRGYEYDGMPITYTKWEGKYYISIREDYLRHRDNGYFYTWEDWHKTDEYNLCDEFNGAYEVDVDKLADNCKKVKAKMDELNEKVKSEALDPYPIAIKLEEEVKMAEAVVEQFTKEFKWYEASSYRLKSLIDYRKSTIDHIERIKKEIDQLLSGNYDLYNLRHSVQHLEEYGYVSLKEDDFYLREMRKEFEK